MPIQAPIFGAEPSATMLSIGPGLRQRDQRLKALKDLVAQLAHTFNNSLAPVAGYVNLLEEETCPNTPSAQYLSRLEASVRRTEGVIQAILLATHPERQFAPVRVDLASLVQRNLDAWTNALPAAALITVNVELAPCVLWLDEGHWSHVIQHLLRNAQEALATGGELHVTLQPRPITAEEQAELEMNDSSVFELVFEDTGGGMSEDVLTQAFDPLFTTHACGPTAGLGLTLVHSVVKLHGGQVALDSVESAGTTVRIWLPASDALG